MMRDGTRKDERAKVVGPFMQALYEERRTYMSGLVRPMMSKPTLWPS